MTTPRTPAKYGFGPETDRVIELTHALLRVVASAANAAAQSPNLKLTEEERAEVADTIKDGLDKFNAASANVAPFQKVMVGIEYLLGAIEECRDKGPLGDKQ